MPETPHALLRSLPSGRAATPQPRDRDRDRDLAALARAAQTGDEAAWTTLVTRFNAPLRGIARSYRLSATDVDDVVQATWLDALQDIHHLRDPAAIAGWLATTTRRKALRSLQTRTREQLTNDPTDHDRIDPEDPEQRVLAAERRRILGDALTNLPERQRRLMTLLLASDPALDYKGISHLLSMPLGSLGPTRARSLARLARNPTLQALQD